MGMYLASPIKPRERILVFGVGGTGKSNGALSIARRINPEDRMFVLDNDLSYDRLLATDYQDVEQAGNVTVRGCDVTEWDVYTESVREWGSIATPDDWLVVDSMSPTWDAVQGWYTEQVFGDDIASYFLEVRKNMKGGKALGAFEGFTDWNVINKVYAKFTAQLNRWPGHLYLTAEQANIGDNDDKDVKGMFGSYGVKPKGQKRLGHITSTTLQMSKARVGGWTLTTIKDRGRRELEGEGIKDFGLDYLMKVAGWKMTKGNGGASE